MKIILNYRLDVDKGSPVETYATAFHRELEALGHDVFSTGEGQEITNFKIGYNEFDFIIDVDNGRNAKGDLGFTSHLIESTTPKAVWFVDSHGQPDLHEALAPKYDHVFFAVWSRRDLFANHKSAHFLPNATHLEYFNKINTELKYDFGAVGSKHGLIRFEPIKRIADAYGWSHRICQINGPFKHKFPYTSQAMAEMRILTNCGQKHDINLRWFESMACGRPLISDRDPKSGVDQLFEPYVHYVPYESYSYNGLEEAMRWTMQNHDSAMQIAERAYNEVVDKHLVKHRVNKMLEILKEKNK